MTKDFDEFLQSFLDYLYTIPCTGKPDCLHCINEQAERMAAQATLRGDSHE